MAALAARALQRHVEHRVVLVRQVRGRREHGAQQEAVAARGRVLVQQVVVTAAALARQVRARGAGGAGRAGRAGGGHVTCGARVRRQVGRGAGEARGAGARQGRGVRQLRARALVHGGRAPRLALHAVCWHWNAKQHYVRQTFN